MNTPTPILARDDDLLLTVAISAHALRVAARALDVARALGHNVEPDSRALMPARVAFERDPQGRVTAAAIRSAGSLLTLRTQRADDGTLLSADFDFEEAARHGA